MADTNRRVLLGVIAAAPVALATMPALAADTDDSDPRWSALVADYRAKRAAWLDASTAADEQAGVFFKARPPEPQGLGSGLPPDIHDMTIREIRAVGDDPDYRAKWAAYETAKQAWDAECDRLRKDLCDAADAEHEAAHDAYGDALDALASYRVSNLPHLAEKIEVLRDD